LTRPPADGDLAPDSHRHGHTHCKKSMEASSPRASKAAAGQPYIPASTSLPEITIKAVVLGVLLSALLAGANAYLGLKVGLTVSASIPAAVISMAVLRMFREHNILENNIVQTAASAGESLAAGVIFTFPALIMLGYWETFEFFPTMMLSLCGGVLGVLFTIPLRRALILEAGLKFPEGVATAEVLKAGTEGGSGVRDIAIAGGAGALLKLAQSGLKVATETVSGSFTVGGAVFGVGSNLSVALLAVGYIIGMNIAVLVFVGGVISWVIGIPLFTGMASPETLQTIGGGAQGYDLANAVWSQQIRYMGVGAMATGGIWALISLMGPIRDGVRSSIEAVQKGRRGEALDIPRTERDTPFHYVIVGTLAMAIPIFYVFWQVVDADHLGITAGTHLVTIVIGVLFAIIAGFLFSSVAGYMAGLVGSSNNPISGVTIATILTISLILLVLLGGQIDFGADALRSTAAAATAVLVGAVVANAAAIAGDNMQDLKAGQILGATPYKQQIMQIVGVLAGAIAIAPILQLLFSAYGLGDVFPRPGMDPTEALQAPQATLMASVAGGVFNRNLPWNMIYIGAMIAIVLIMIDRMLERRGSDFRTPVLAVAVGIYLPLELSVAIFAGGMIAWLASRHLRANRARLGDSFEDVVAAAGRRGLLFCSGLITGEALIGIALAIPFAAAQNTDVVAIAPDNFETPGILIGSAAFIGFCLWLYNIARSEAAVR
jgi:putative OPT family oligopeptide transporter